MAHVITDGCVKDYLCVDSCSTYAIHPAKDEPKAEEVTHLFINPDECIDCGNCVVTCPSGAIFPIDELPPDKAGFAAKNAAFFN